MRALDTNIIIFHILNDSRFGKRASEIMGKIDKGEEIFVPLAVLKETMFNLLAHGKELSDIIEILFLFQKDTINIAEDDFIVFMQGLELANRYKIDATDGIIASLMFQYDISEIYSNDTDFDKIPGIKRVF